MDLIETSSNTEATTLRLTNLESALGDAEQQSRITSEVFAKLLGLVKSFQRSAGIGDLKAIHKLLDALPGQLGQAQQAADALRSKWEYSEQEEERYFSSGDYTRELMSAARAAGLSLSEQEGVLACFPSLLKVQSRERGILIDRKLSREIRPSKLVARLAENQKRSSNFKAGPFLDSLYTTYKLLCHGKSGGEMQKLLDIYGAWTVRPGQKREYSIQEFTREIYQLDAAGAMETSDGKKFRLDRGATGSKNRSNLLVIVNREGVECTYYGIEFQ